MRTPWEVLGIRVGASPAEITAAHRRRSLLLHPDRAVGATEEQRAEAHTAMAELNAARDVLLAASRGWEPASGPVRPSTAVARWRPRDPWAAELAPEPARGALADVAA